MTAESWPIAIYLGVGLGTLLAGLGIFIACLRAGALFTRLGKTLDEVDQQIGVMSGPIASTLTHVGGIADTADSTLARLAAVVSQLENVATGASKTANLIGSTLSGITSAMRKPRDASEEHNG
jgi:ABC-type transporter Mla subunit MlaD